jgi:hypothetical protein
MSQPMSQPTSQPDSRRILLLTLATVLGLGAVAVGIRQWGLLGGGGEVSGADRSAELFGSDPTQKPAVTTMQGEAFTDGNLDAVSTEPDRYWQLDSYAKFYPALKPFRKPKGFDETMLPKGRWPSFWDDIRQLYGIRNGAPADKISYDENGREIVDTAAWRTALERVRISNLKLAGHVAQVFRDSTSLQLRREGLYGLFYFDEIQDVLDLAAQICAEPDRQTRQEGFERTLRFLAVHLPKSVAIRPDLEGSPVQPKYKFNIWGYLQLVRLENDPRSQVEGLRFLSEVLRIRPDLGRAYLIEIKDMIPELLASRATSVREETVRFLSMIDRNKHKAPPANADAGELMAWYDEIAYELLPPVEHVSTGKTILHPSKDLDDIISVGQRALASEGTIGTVKLIALPSGSLRKGLEVHTLPKPLHLLGIPKGSLITTINTTPIESSKQMLDCIRKETELHHKQVEEVLKQRAEKKDPKIPIRPLVFQVWYVHKGKELAKDFHVVQ